MNMQRGYVITQMSKVTFKIFLVLVFFTLIDPSYPIPLYHVIGGAMYRFPSSLIKGHVVPPSPIVSNNSVLCFTGG